MFNYLMSSDKVDRKSFIHLGSRSGLKPNIEAFINMYPPEKWKKLTCDSYGKAFESAKK